MEIREIKTIFGKRKYYLFEDGKQCVNLTFEHAEKLPNTDLYKVMYKNKLGIVDNSIIGKTKADIVSAINYENIFDYDGFFVLENTETHMLNFVDKKTKQQVVAHGFIYCSVSSKFLVYSNWNDYTAFLSTANGMERYAFPNMETKFCVEPLFRFTGSYSITAQIISSFEKPRKVYKIIRNFLKRLLQEDIANFDKATQKYCIPSYDQENVALKTMTYSTPDEAKQEANKVLKHFDDVVLRQFKIHEEFQKQKQTSALEREQQKQQREQDIQAALDDFNAEDSNIVAQ